MFRGILRLPSNLFSKYVRDKPHVNVGTIGHVDHGKSSLTSAISKYMASVNENKYYNMNEIDKSPEEKSRGITINNTTIEYISDKYHYGHVDCPGHEDYVKNMITGAAKMDCGILVVSAPDGAMPQTKEHIMLCKQIGVKNIIVFLNKVDQMPDPEMHELVEMEIKELLEKYDYDPEKAVFVRGSALCALNDTNPEIGVEKIKELIQVMDDNIQLPARDIDKPFLMSVESVYNIEGRGAVSTGTVESGKAKVGKDIEVCKGGKKIKTTITGIETFKKTMDYAEAGDNVGILTRGLTKNDLSRGMILADPGVVSFSTCAEANVYFNKIEEGGRKNGFYTGFKPQAYFRTCDVASELKLPENVKVGMPGDNLTVQMRFNTPVFIQDGLRFALRDSGKTIGHGLITKLLPDDAVPANLSRVTKLAKGAAAEQ